MEAHEAAHIVQQRGGVQLAYGLDAETGDPHEQHADAVATAVVAGESAEPLLDGFAGSSTKAGSAVQRNSGGDVQPSSSTLVGPELYLSVLGRDVWHGIHAHLSTVPWPNPHPHMALQNDRTFVDLRKRLESKSATSVGRPVVAS